MNTSEPSLNCIIESEEIKPIYSSIFLLQKHLKLIFKSFSICLQAEMQAQLIKLNETSACKIVQKILCKTLKFLHIAERIKTLNFQNYRKHSHLFWVDNTQSFMIIVFWLQLCTKTWINVGFLKTLCKKWNTTDASRDKCLIML